MKTTKSGSANPREAVQTFLARAEVVFRAYPELLSFCVEPEAGPSAVSTPVESETFDLYVGLAMEVSDDFQQEMCEAISEFITETVHENPETLEILRGRTFARTLH